MKDFTAKYGIKITDANPDGSSQDEINAIQQLKGQSRAPDVVDMGAAFAIKGDQAGLFAPYKVATGAASRPAAKAADGDLVRRLRRLRRDRLRPGQGEGRRRRRSRTCSSPIYKNQVAINGNPTQASAAFSAVYAAALANGGSLANIEPGIDVLQEAAPGRQLRAGHGGPATVQSGQTPIVIWWDYLLGLRGASAVAKVQDRHPDRCALRRLLRPGDQQDGAGPGRRPAVGGVPVLRPPGQNLWLEGKARPIELPTLISNGTVNKAANAALPAAPAGGLSLPTQAQESAAEAVVAQQWSTVTG